MYPALYDLSTSFIPPISPEAWYAWLWIAPLRLLAWLIGALLIVMSLAVLFLIFLLLGTVIASPFLDVLAQRVEDIIAGRPAADNLTLRHAMRSFTVSVEAELKRLGFFVAVGMTLFLLGLIPLLSPFTVVAATLFTLLFLPLQYAGYAMDHRVMSFAQRRALIWQHRWLMLGFGASASLTLLIPLLNFICLPILVVGATLLIRHAEGSVQH
jgi:CysZ protein